MLVVLAIATPVIVTEAERYKSYTVSALCKLLKFYEEKENYEECILIKSVLDLHEYNVNQMFKNKKV